MNANKPLSKASKGGFEEIVGKREEVTLRDFSQ
jgi:hypothetical protein